MCDISVEPRWGRVSEGAGEDPYLGSRIAEAMVRGYQGEDLSDPTTIAACVKHFAAYGAPQAGRDYNTVDMSERWFAQSYLAIDQGPIVVMIENYRSGAVWDAFMSNDDIAMGLVMLGFSRQ